MSQDITVEFVSGADDDVDVAELELLTHSLREEILQVDEVDSVEQPIAGPAPEGAKAVDIAQIGALIVAAAPTVTALTKIIETVRGWFERRKAADPTAPTPTLRMTIGGNSIEIVADKEQQRAAFDVFISAVKLEQA